MATTVARILQSHGLNANISSLQARELGLTDDTERPVIGSTAGGAKWIGTEDFISINTASPSAVPLLRRSYVSIFCDAASAGASIALDIRAGAQVVGYRCMVFCTGPDNRQVVCVYATGAVEYIPGGMAQEFVWTGTAWNKTRMSWSERYEIGDQVPLAYKPTLSCRAPYVDRSTAQTLDAANWPGYVPILRGIKSAIGTQADFTGTASSGTGSFTVTLDNTTPNNLMISAIQAEAISSAYQSGGEIANFGGGSLFGTGASGQLMTLSGIDYQITALNAVSRQFTMSGNSPGAGAVTANFFPYRYLGSTTKAILPGIGGFVSVPIGDAGYETVQGKRILWRTQGHWHVGFCAGLNIAAVGAGGGNPRGNGGSNNTLSDSDSIRSPISDGFNGVVQSGKNTRPLENPLNYFDWGGVYIP